LKALPNAEIKMDPNKLFEDLTWAYLTLVEDELKAVQEFEIRTIKHKDL